MIESSLIDQGLFRIVHRKGIIFKSRDTADQIITGILELSDVFLIGIKTVRDVFRGRRIDLADRRIIGKLRIDVAVLDIHDKGVDAAAFSCHIDVFIGRRNSFGVDV